MSRESYRELRGGSSGIEGDGPGPVGPNGTENYSDGQDGGVFGEGADGSGSEGSGDSGGSDGCGSGSDACE